MTKTKEQEKVAKWLGIEQSFNTGFTGDGTPNGVREVVISIEYSNHNA